MKKQYKISTEFFSANVHPYAVYLGDGFYDEYPEIIEWASQQFGGDGCVRPKMRDGHIHFHIYGSQMRLIGIGFY